MGSATLTALTLTGLLVLMWAGWEAFYAVRRASVLSRPKDLRSLTDVPATRLAAETHLQMQFAIQQPDAGISPGPHQAVRKHLNRTDALESTSIFSVAGLGTALWDRFHSNPEFSTVYKTFSQWSGETITNKHDLLSHFANRPYALGTDGFRVKLRGHMGEHRLQELMGDNLDSTSWPLASNNPGWDFTTGSTDVNVKIGSSTRALYEHLQEHPDILLAVNEDMAGLPADTPILEILTPDSFDQLADHSVVAIAGLSVSDLDRTATEWLADLDATDAVGDGVALGFALRLIRTSIKEGKSYKEHKDLRSALFNTTVKTGTAAAGFWAGAKAGASGGALIDASTGGATLGIPTLIAGLAGGIAGATGGSIAGQRIVDVPLRRKSASCKQSLENYESVAKSAAKNYSSMTRARRYDARCAIEEIDSDAQLQVMKAMGAFREKIRELDERLVQETLLAFSVALDHLKAERPPSVVAAVRRRRWLDTHQNAATVSDRLAALAQLRDDQGIGSRLARHAHDSSSSFIATTAQVAGIRTRQLSARNDWHLWLAAQYDRAAEQLRTTTYPPLHRLWSSINEFREQLIRSRGVTRAEAVKMLPLTPEPQLS